MDTAALRDLSTNYAASVDALDGPGFAAQFTADGELWVPDAAHDYTPTICIAGSAALERIPSGLARYHSTRHEVVGATYDGDSQGDSDGGGDRATGEITGIAHHLSSAPVDPDGPTGGDPADLPGTDTIWHLRYVDDYRRGANGWRIARRVLHLDRVEEQPVDRLGPGRGRPRPRLPDGLGARRRTLGAHEPACPPT